MLLFTIKPGAEPFALHEPCLEKLALKQCGPGLVSSAKADRFMEGSPCFPSWQLVDAVSHKPQARERPIDWVDSWFRSSIASERIDSQWPLVWLTYSDNGFTPGTPQIERLSQTLKKRISRIVKLAYSDHLAIESRLRGLFVVQAIDGTLFVSREAVYYGQQRMRDDPQAPSRSYLKIEEALAIFGRAPQAGQMVVDLGAAPGGWSWAAAKRGAHVAAIDNGPLKKAAAECAGIEHRRSDAYAFKPTAPVDWLFCDMVDSPRRVMELVRRWLSNAWCSFAIVNLKYGQADPIAVLKSLYGPEGLAPPAKQIICRHLFHDRDECTVMIEAKA